MEAEKVHSLITLAEKRMAHSRDPLHDLSHVRRVVAFTETFGKSIGLNSRQQEALRLAAWWHDVSRTINRNPSIIVMPFIDDILSALLLWRESIRLKVFGNVVGMATRMIFCKSLGTGKLLSRILMRKKNRIMIDVLQDADMIDIVNIERTKQMYTLVEMSRLYQFSYKLMIWWFLSLQKLQLKTTVAKQHFVIILKEFIAWIKQHDVRSWHIERFGKKWVEKNIGRAELFLISLQHLLAMPQSPSFSR